LSGVSAFVKDQVGGCLVRQATNDETAVAGAIKSLENVMSGKSQQDVERGALWMS